MTVVEGEAKWELPSGTKLKLIGVKASRKEAR